MIEFADILYGTISIPDWLLPFLKIPEFARLRGVRLSNVDSFQFKDFSGPARWEHGVAVAWLALRCAEKRALPEKERIELALAALLHDVATPPFAHTAEYVLEAFDHEIESQRLLAGDGNGSLSNSAVFASHLPRFQETCVATARQLGVKIDVDRVAQMIVGDTELGFLIHGSVDLDNADNVTRACRYLGIEVDPRIPLKLADWLAAQSGLVSELGEVPDSAVATWLKYRAELYGRFFQCTDAELSRQAFLQHLMRRGLSAGLSRESLIWNTDERLLFAIEQLPALNSSAVMPSLAELVQRYRLLEEPEKIAHVELDDGALATVGLPQSVAWIETKLATPFFQPFVAVIRSRHGRTSAGNGLFPPAPGTLLVFRLGGSPKESHLPAWLRRSDFRSETDRFVARAEMSRRLGPHIAKWSEQRPWIQERGRSYLNVASNLSNYGNWGFRLSRNDSLHAYPGTFVHAIPAALITSLGIQGGTVVDPFGGTGQTACEAVRLGCVAVSGDVNQIAYLAARTRLTYLTSRCRKRLRMLGREEIAALDPLPFGEFAHREKWFHPRTLLELGSIKAFIERRRDLSLRQFLTVSLSAAITSCTGRRGKEHGYFADNTPLEKGVSKPPYRDAIGEFLARVSRNLSSLERYYLEIERTGVDPSFALARASVVKVNAGAAAPEDYGLSKGCVDAVVTSPPYLCMADYTLGQRLSYAMLFPGQLDVDVQLELGRRRQRFQGEKALRQYLVGLQQFVSVSSEMLRTGGYLATVLGTPTAARFAGFNATLELDRLSAAAGFQKIWETNRPISWHRNHGYARLKDERISVHIKTS